MNSYWKHSLHSNPFWFHSLNWPNEALCGIFVNHKGLYISWLTNKCSSFCFYRNVIFRKCNAPSNSCCCSLNKNILPYYESVANICIWFCTSPSRCMIWLELFHGISFHLQYFFIRFCFHFLIYWIYFSTVHHFSLY